MLRKLTSSPPELIFIDTLYHFQETLDLKDEVKRRYGVKVNVYRPSGVNTAAEFEALYGERLWETNDAVYDYWAKVHFPPVALLRVPLVIHMCESRLSLHNAHIAN